MLKILALGAHRELRALKPQLKELDIDLYTSLFTGVRIEVVENKTDIYIKDRNLEDFDFVWIKSSWNRGQVANAITMYLTHHKIPHTKVETEKSKLVDNVRLATNSINIPNTFYCPTGRLMNNMKHIERVCEYPVIIKTTRGSLGRDIFLALDREQLEGIINNQLKKHKNYICQEFIPNDFDYRIIVSGQRKILSAEKRIRQKDEFRNNAYFGAKEVFLKEQEIDDDLRDISLNASQALNLNWTGIDIVKSNADNSLYVLELNRRPGLTLESSEISAAYEHILSLLAKRGLYIES